MRFAVAVLVPDATEPVVVDIDAEPSTTVAKLANALCEDLGVPTGDRLEGRDMPTVHVASRPVDRASSLAEAGIEDGVLIGLGRPLPFTDRDVALVEVRVIGGPGAGVTHRLVPGSFDVGSDPRCRVRIDGRPLAGTITVRTSGDVDYVSLGEGGTLDGHPLTTGEAAPWVSGTVLSLDDVLLEVAEVAVRSASVTPSEDGAGRLFNRPPRVVETPPRLRLRLPRAVGELHRASIPILPLVLVPIVASALTVVVTGNWRFIIFGVLSPVAALLMRSGSAKSQRRQHERRVEEHRTTMDRLDADLDLAVTREQRARRRDQPDPATLLTTATLPTDRLWERRRTDPDFLTVRIGTGTVPSLVTVENTDEDEHRRDSIPDLLDVPITVDLSVLGVIGVVGIDAARSMVAQICVLHSPLDVGVCILTGEAGADDWHWTRWLPHVRRGVGRLALGTTTDSVARRIAELVRVVETRSAVPRDRRPTEAERPVVLVLDGARRLRSLPGVVTLLREGPSVGVHVVCVDTEEERLPEECAAVVSVGVAGRGRLALGDGSVRDVRVDAPTRDWYDAVARGLAPLQPIGEEDGGTLPDSVRLLQLLGLDYATMAEEVAGRWVLSPRSTSSVLGAGVEGPFELDLVRDGPHGLVAGTTGAGKSELLQTLVASFAVANRPDELNFVLVDYKGGSAFAECAVLPHTVGLVTDLDTQLVERALTSLDAELRTREHLLADVGAKDIGDYTERRAVDPTMTPLPRLLIVIDEFASMARELPDFVTGLVNLAQRGRSLGIHLVLATQRPAGVVSSDIRANTNLRIALRTTDANESRDIIDAPDSAQLSPSLPGRAYARLNASLLLPFQAARIGGRRMQHVDTTSHDSQVLARQLTWAELGSDTSRLLQSDGTARTGTSGTLLAAGNSQARGVNEPVTDLALLATALAEAAERLDVPMPRRPWLPPLPDRVDLDLGDLTVAPSDNGRLRPAAWALVDDPERQEQRPLTFDLATQGHLYLMGASQSGRSQALRSLAASLAAAVAAHNLHLYAIDSGTGALNVLEGLPHTGAVVSHRSTERLGRLLDRLGDIVRERQQLLGRHGAADLEELRGQLRAEQRPPHVVLLIDGFEIFTRDFASFDNGSYVDRLIALLRDGSAVGVHLVLAGDRSLASSRYAGGTDDKLVLRLNDPSDWSMVGVRPRDVPGKLPAGRAVRPGRSQLTQIGVLPTPGLDQVDGSAQAAAFAEVATTITARDASIPPDARPQPLLGLPDRITLAEVLEAVEPLPPRRAVVGVGGDDLSVLGPDFTQAPTFLVAGPPRSGRSTALSALAISMLRRGDAGAVVVAPRRSPLRQLASHPAVTAVLTDGNQLGDQLTEALRSVSQELGLLVIDDAELVLSGEAAHDIAALARGAAGDGWVLLAAGNSDALVSSVGGWVAQVRRNRQGLLLSPQSQTEGELVGVRLGRGAVGGRPVPGRGWLHLGDGDLVSVQVPDNDVTDLMPATSVTGVTDHKHQ